MHSSSTGALIKKGALRVRPPLFIVNPIFNLINVGVDDGYGGNINDIAYRRAKVGEVYGFLESHLYRTDNLHVSL